MRCPRGKIFILRHDDHPVLDCTAPDRIIVRVTQPDLGNMNGFVPRFAQLLGERRGQLRIDQKLHFAPEITAWSS